MKNDILKDFFRKPIVAVTSAVIFLTVTARTLISFTGIFGDELLDDFSEDGLFLELLKSIDFLGLFLATAFLIFFIQSRGENSNLNFASLFFKTGSVIGLILIIIASVICLAFLLILALAMCFGMALFFIRFLPMAILSAGVFSALVTVVLVVLALFILLAISQLLFAGSVRKVVREGTIRRGTAMFFAVINFTLAFVLLLIVSIITIIDGDGQAAALTVNMLLDILPYMFVGMTALSYFRHMKKAP